MLFFQKIYEFHRDFSHFFRLFLQNPVWYVNIQGFTFQKKKTDSKYLFQISSYSNFKKGSISALLRYFMLTSAKIMTSSKFWWHHFVCMMSGIKPAKFHLILISGSEVMEGGQYLPPPSPEEPPNGPAWIGLRMDEIT